ncbi:MULTISPECIES: HAD family hydrolase [Actinomyces]|uniref:HAD family phosphatase n=1 Tax=Actinomyces respiraculi TaxID=2744574 RepID=A0A7T0LKM2_9ACTO|nr:MULTISPECIES: HAD family hydrolase [Actinomyces]QPL05509.1 HAD family phosphatase [Actinomyces respiraculi]
MSNTYSTGTLPVSVLPSGPRQDLSEIPDGPRGLGGSTEFLNGARGALRPLSDGEYAALVRERAADLDRLDPGGRHLVAGPSLVVALDVDGTILDMDGRVSMRVRASIDALRRRGAHVVIATGRGVQAAVPVAHHVGLTEGWMVCANGALTLRMDPNEAAGHSVVEQITFDPAAAIDALLEAVPEGIIAVEDVDSGFRTTRLFPEGELIERQTVVSLDDLRSRPVSRVILRAPGMPVSRFSELVVGAGLHSVEYAIGWTAWLDVAPNGITKASALDALATELGTDASCAIAVGDGTNDLEMLQWARVGAVMGSAPTEVQEVGDLVTEPVWRDGCAALLDAVLLRSGAATHPEARA